MKPTKHIQQLAQQICKADPYCDLAYTTRKLMDYREALLKGRYYTRVESVSRSGMSRRISIAIIKDNMLFHAPQYIYKMAGCTKNGVISGCGMDMLFAAQFDLFSQLCPEKMYQSAMKRYNNL